MTLSEFFSATTIAVDALMANTKAKPYRNIRFHLGASITLLCHLVRALNDIVGVVVLLLKTIGLLNPFTWIDLPGWGKHFVDIVDDAIAFSISLVTITLHTPVVLTRTLSTMIWGYTQDSEYDSDDAAREEIDDAKAARTMFYKASA